MFVRKWSGWICGYIFSSMTISSSVMAVFLLIQSPKDFCCPPPGLKCYADHCLSGFPQFIHFFKVVFSFPPKNIWNACITVHQNGILLSCPYSLADSARLQNNRAGFASGYVFNQLVNWGICQCCKLISNNTHILKSSSISSALSQSRLVSCDFGTCNHKVEGCICNRT